MNISKADVARLGRQRLQPVKAEGELLAVFVPGVLVNPLNAHAWGWQKRSRMAKRWKESVATALLESGWKAGAQRGAVHERQNASRPTAEGAGHEGASVVPSPSRRGEPLFKVPGAIPRSRGRGDGIVPRQLGVRRQTGEQGTTNPGSGSRAESTAALTAAPSNQGRAGSTAAARSPLDASGPKVVAFLAHTGGRMDSDGLQASLKPCRDALVECGVVSGDADRDGHRFEYSQRIDRTNRGVAIRVKLAP